MTRLLFSTLALFLTGACTTAGPNDAPAGGTTGALGGAAAFIGDYNGIAGGPAGVFPF